MKILLGIAGLVALFLTRKKGNDRDNRYFPVQSDSERIAGHPIVGVN